MTRRAQAGRDALRSDDLFVVESARTAACSPDDVMTHVLDPHTWPRWQPEIVTIDGPPRLKEGDLSTGTATMLGYHVVGQSRAAFVGERRFEEDVLVGVYMRVHYEVEPRGDVVVISRRIEAALPKGLLGRPLAFLLRRRLRAMQKKVLDELVAQSEAAARS